MKYIGSCLVEDARGCQFHVYEFRARGWFRDRQLMLEDGERIERTGAGQFKVSRTGEILLRVE